MIVIREPLAVQHINNVTIRTLVQQRIAALEGDGFDVADAGYFLVVDPGDTAETISTQLGFPILFNHLTGQRWDTPDFTPPFELIEEFQAVYSIVFVVGQDGTGVEVFVPDAEGVNSELLAMCRRFAIKGAP